MRNAIILTLTVLGLCVNGLARTDQSGRVRRVNAQPRPAATEADPAGTPEAAAPSAPQTDPAGTTTGTTAQASAPPEKIAVNVKCNARYDGGSLNLDRNQKLVVTVKDGILALNTKGSSFEIPTSQVTDLSYSQKSRDRTAEGIGVGAVSPTAGVLLGRTKTTAHYLTVQWTGNPAGGVSLRIDKDDIRGVLAALEAATGIRSRVDGPIYQ